MQHDDPRHAEEIIQQRLTQLGGYRIGGAQFGMRGLLLAFAIAPCLLWLAYLAWPHVVSVATAPRHSAPAPSPVSEADTDRETPLVLDAFVPIVVSSVVAAIVAFVAVRSLRDRAKYGLLVAMSVCGTCVVVALAVWIAGQGGLIMVASADAGDIFATYALPVGVMVSLGALVGWKVAELE